MQLHTIKATKEKRKKTRIGRGGKRGTFAGRGTKGQRSRAGRRIRKAERDLIIRLPKKRGFRNKIKGPKPITIDLSKLLKNIKPLIEKDSKIVVNPEMLKSLRLISKRYSGVIKVLGKGDVSRAINFKGLTFSQNVKMKIEQAGGTVA
jgi:large subunit ribosomal protein L15